MAYVDYKRLARKYAQKEHLDPHIFQRQIGAESNFNPHAGSPAGAQGIAQIMPSTAKSWGVDPNNPAQALGAAAKHMANYVKKYGSYEAALRAYNAGEGAIEKSKGFGETNAYVKKILMNGRDPGKLTSGSTQDPGLLNDASHASQLGVIPGTSSDAPKKPSVFDIIRQYDAATSGDVTGADTSLDDSLAQSQQMLMEAIARKREADTPQVTSPAVMGSSFDQPQGAFKITGPDPKRLKPVLVDFAEKVAATYGKPLTGSDGSGHSLRTATGGISQHSTGNATDIPASGAELISMGQAALIAAGMPESQARKQTGGLFNIGSHQIIFNDRKKISGSPHDDHLHISAR